ncbi:MAG: TonB-dependent receptor domain-containing protein, partial [Flavobacteriales bacterium]
APEMNYISLITRGNSGLDPEESRAYEFGVKQGTGKVAYSVSIFKTKVRNAISYVYLWDGSIGIDTLGNDWMRDDYRGDRYINLGTQTNTGLEINLAANLSEKVELRTNLCIVNGRLHYSNADIDTSATRGNHVQLFESGAFVSGDVDVNGLIRRSATANIALIYNPFPKLSLRLEGNHVGPRYDVFYDAGLGPYGALGTSVVSDYTLLNFATLWHVNEHITLNFRINNFENKQYTEINGFSTKGRAFYLSVRFAF